MTRPARRILLALLAVLPLLMWGAGPTAARAGELPRRAAGEESITALDIRARLERDGSMSVVERVTWDFGGRSGHGIRRAITTAQDTSSSGRYRQYVLKDASASSPSGAPADLQMSAEGPNTVLRIGSPGTSVSGRQTYEIHYRLLHVVNAVGNHAELYWNFPGFQVGVPVEGLHIRVEAPGHVNQAGCVSGPARSTNRCPASVDGESAAFSPPDLAPYTTATVSLQMPKELFSDTSADLRSGSAMDHGYLPSFADEMPVGQARAVSWGGYLGGPALALLGAALMGVLVWRRGRDEQYVDAVPGLTPADPQDQRVRRGATRAAAVQFSPPEDVEPGLLGTVLDERANPIDVSATVVDLAARGYLTIEEVEGGLMQRDDWLLTRTELPVRSLRPYEVTILAGLFDRGPSVRLSELRRHYAETLQEAQRQMYQEVVDRGWFRASPQAQRRVWQGVGIVLAALGALGAFLSADAGAQIDRRSGVSMGVPSLLVLFLGLIVTGAVVFLLGRHMAWRTARGSMIQAQSLGFRQYLATAEAGQIRFEEAAGIFSRYLPYAIVYGVADRWAATFERVAKAAEAAGTPVTMPSWYLFYGSGFGFGSFGSRLDDFATTSTGTFAASAAATPGSSGGSAFDGGGFGGFSGGGGGGGGFGSW